MKASALIRQRRSFGNWLAYAFPDEADDDTRTPGPPPEKKEAGPPRPALPPETPAPTTTPAKPTLT
jgi:hypothetical protein